MRTYQAVIEGPLHPLPSQWEQSPHQPNTWWASCRCPSQAEARKVGEELSRRFPQSRVFIFTYRPERALDRCIFDSKPAWRR